MVCLLKAVKEKTEEKKGKRGGRFRLSAADNGGRQWRRGSEKKNASDSGKKKRRKIPQMTEEQTKTNLNHNPHDQLMDVLECAPFHRRFSSSSFGAIGFAIDGIPKYSSSYFTVGHHTPEEITIVMERWYQT